MWHHPSRVRIFQTGRGAVPMLAESEPIERWRVSRNSPGMRLWRVALVEDHVLQRRRTEEIITKETDLCVVASCSTLPEFLEWVRRAPALQRPDLLILDLSVDHGPSVDPRTVEALTGAGLRILVLSALASPDLVRSVLQAGVAGVVGKRDSEEAVVQAIWAVLNDGEWMTPDLAAIIASDRDRPSLSDQEERALVLYASGLTLPAVAQALMVKPETAKTYLARVKAKYGAAGRPIRSKVDLSRAAHDDGYLTGPV